MDITPLIKSGQQVVEGYGVGFFRIAGKVWEQPVIVMPEETAAWDRRNDFDWAESFFRSLGGDASFPEILLIGTGATSVMIAPEIRQAFRDKGISIDVMDTPAACRTYNVLMPEGRSVAAALIPV
ncbi:MAG: Mth938-like domain-containing protein [Rhodospirillales bacterium]|nr:Mth938-like domain-containing protein [Rhodospirillales bacterium]